MMIKVLPSNVADIIAAGEVVQRPASVVKELVENAVDAGADSICVELLDAGRTLIKVTDNGCGMSGEDMLLCFQRHATSKIASAEDLDSISTYGFRGEALPSIASISHVTIRSRMEDDELATQYGLNAGVPSEPESLAAPKGTSIEVRDIFFNTPARRKFLKSDNAEFKQILSEFTRVALTRPGVSFRLIHNCKEIYNLGKEPSLKKRIIDIFGKECSENLLDVHNENTVARTFGYVSTPEASRKTGADQFFFVNGRYFRSPFLHKAIMNAYENLIPSGYAPSYFIYLEMDASKVDVNVSPTKTEVKFCDDSLLFQNIYAVVKETLGKLSLSGSIDFESAEIPDIPIASKFSPGIEPILHIDSTYDPFKNDGYDRAQGAPFPESGYGGGTSFPDSRYGQGTSRFTTPSRDYGAIFEDKAFISNPLMVVRNKYILTATAQGILVVNISRAFQRIMYERFLSALKGGANVCCTSLFPSVVRVAPEVKVTLESNSELLEKLGFDIKDAGERGSIVLSGVPQAYEGREDNPTELLLEISEALEESRVNSLQEMMQSSLAQRLAKIRSSLKSEINLPEARKIVDELFDCPSCDYTPEGKKTMALLEYSDLDKMF